LLPKIRITIIGIAAGFHRNMLKLILYLYIYNVIIMCSGTINTRDHSILWMMNLSNALLYIYYAGTILFILQNIIGFSMICKIPTRSNDILSSCVTKVLSKCCIKNVSKSTTPINNAIYKPWLIYWLP